MLIWLLLFHLQACVASVYMGFPFSEQLPNVARVNQPYSFTMANTTYKSWSGSVEYGAQNLPKWLKFDSASRTFLGTPGSDDVGTFEVTVSGLDSSDGSYIANNYSMIVSTDPGLHLRSQDVMFTQIARYGRTNGVDGLVVSQGEKFSLQFNLLDFVSNDDSSRPIVAYYGRSRDRSSLPNWIGFDASTLTFSGTVPYVASENAPSMEYGFSFIASDYKGYAGAEGIFKLVVGGHQLSTAVNETVKLNGTLGSAIDEEVPVLSEVYLDGQPIDKANISVVEASDLPNYLHFDSSNYTISGNFPSKATYDNFTIEVADVYGNSVLLPYLVDAIGSVFTVKDLADVNATRGQFFSYQLMQSIFTDLNDTKVLVLVPEGWLVWHKDNMTLNGMAPKKLDLVTALITASLPFDEETKKMKIVGVDKTSTSSSSSASSSSTSTSTSSASSTSSSSPSSTATNKSSLSHKKALAIGLGVGIPCFLLILAALFLLLWMCRRRRSEKDSSGEASDHPDPNVILGGVAGAKTSQDTAGPGAAAMLKTKHDEAHSASSSITHVDSRSDEDLYYDATEKPLKSWRADNVSDEANATGSAGLYRTSNASMSTVNTDQLFSVRLIDDNSYRQSSQLAMVQPTGQFMSQGSLNALLNSDSGNFQRIDSDGNIHPGDNVVASPSQSPRKKISRSPSENLHVVMEESRARQGDDINTSLDPNVNEPPSQSSSYKFLNRFNSSEPNSTLPSASSSDQQISHSFVGDFKATRHQDGTFEWLDSSRENLLASPPQSPSKRLSQHSAGSRLSINNYVGNKAKLVDFTRKGSLRESAYEPDREHHEESAQIQDESE